MRKNHHISVIIPALNEERAIGKVLSEIPEWVDHIIVADNGSEDGTPEVAVACGAEVVVEPETGYGAACLAGMRCLGETDIVVFLDGDNSDYPADMERLVDPIISDTVDLMIGSRRLGQSEPGALSIQARFGNWLSCALIYWIWKVRFTDLGPFRAIRAETLKNLDMQDRNYGWTVEMQIKAAKARTRVSEAPVRYRKRIGRSKVSGTIKGVIGAGTKILYTIGRHAVFAAGSVQTMDDMDGKISVIIPTLNEADCVEQAIEAAKRDENVEIIVVDGGSTDDTAAIAQQAGAVVVTSDRGRAVQMNRGAEMAAGDILLFLHADTRLPEDYGALVRRAIYLEGRAGGAFRLKIKDAGGMLSFIETCVRFRADLLHVPFGDQAIFVRSELFHRLNGYKELPIMEDLEFVRRLVRAGRIRVIPAPVQTSARRWNALGVLRTTLVNQGLILGYFLGIPVKKLAIWQSRITRRYALNYWKGIRS